MMIRTLYSLVAALVLVTGTPADAQSTSDLLEKGIYTEQTVGDLDGAIKIYRKIVADGKANREFVARAQYRLANCLLKQGKKKEAQKAFQELIKDFPDQKELVAKARTEMPEAHPGLKLSPVTWKDGEVLQFRMKMAGGLPIGAAVCTAESAKVDGRDVWRFRSYCITTPTASTAVSRVDADKETFRPISSVFNHSKMGTTEATYSPTGVDITTSAIDGSTSIRTAKLDGVVYDYQQGEPLFRRLPLEVGKKFTTPIYVTFGGGYVPIELDVVGKETLKVPAGSFECHKVELAIVGQTYWFSADEKRYVVKQEGDGITAELESIRHRKAGEPNVYHHAEERTGDSENLFSLTAPNGWFFYRTDSTSDDGKSSVYLLDPEADRWSVVQCRKLKDLEEDHRTSVRAWAEHESAQAQKTLKEYKVRPDSWKERKVSGRPAVSFLADYVAGKQQRVAYSVYVLGQSTVLDLNMKADKELFDGLRTSFDAIADSCKVK